MIVHLQVLPGTFAGKKDMVELQRRVLVRDQAELNLLSLLVCEHMIHAM